MKRFLKELFLVAASGKQGGIEFKFIGNPHPFANEY
jgi:hypothetical protein